MMFRTVWISRERAVLARKPFTYYVMHDVDPGVDDVRSAYLSENEYAATKRAYDDLRLGPGDPGYGDPAWGDRFAEAERRIELLYSISRLR